MASRAEYSDRAVEPVHLSHEDRIQGLEDRAKDADRRYARLLAFAEHLGRVVGVDEPKEGE